MIEELWNGSKQSFTTANLLIFLMLQAFRLREAWLVPQRENSLPFNTT